MIGLLAMAKLKLTLTHCSDDPTPPDCARTEDTDAIAEKELDDEGDNAAHDWGVERREARLAKLDDVAETRAEPVMCVGCVETYA